MTKKHSSLMPEAVEPDEVATLLAEAREESDPAEFVVRLGLFAGLRPSEYPDLTASSITVDDGCHRLTINGAKGPRTVVVAATVAEALEAARSGLSGDDPLFPGYGTERIQADISDLLADAGATATSSFALRSYLLKRLADLEDLPKHYVLAYLGALGVTDDGQLPLGWDVEVATCIDRIVTEDAGLLHR